MHSRLFRVRVILKQSDNLPIRSHIHSYRQHHPIRSLSTNLPPRTMSTLIPPSSWDSHMHVTEPDRFPPSPHASYTPHAAPLGAALANAEKLNLPNLVLVQPSTYGLDNSCLLDALKTLGPQRARGVVAIDPLDRSEKARARMREWYALGVRGVRLNVKSVAKTTTLDGIVPSAEERRQQSEKLRDGLLAHIRAVKALNQKGWVVQVYVDMASIGPVLEEVAGALRATGSGADGGEGGERDVKLVLDHLGTPSAEEVSAGKGLAECEGGEVLKRVLDANRGVYVKVSAPYRMSRDKWEDLERLTRDLFEARGGEAVVFASDWPHTRFEGMDVEEWVRKCVDWCGGDEGLRTRLFRDNARVLWDV